MVNALNMLESGGGFGFTYPSGEGYVKPNVIPLIPYVHFVQQLYHKTGRSYVFTEDF